MTEQLTIHDCVDMVDQLLRDAVPGVALGGYRDIVDAVVQLARQRDEALRALDDARFMRDRAFRERDEALADRDDAELKLNRWTMLHGAPTATLTAVEALCQVATEAARLWQMAVVPTDDPTEVPEAIRDAYGQLVGYIDGLRAGIGGAE